MYISFRIFFILSCLLFFIKSFAFAQLSFRKPVSVKEKSGLSTIAYKLPYRGDNYKFYGTIRFHIYGRAFVNNKVFNTFIEAQHLSKQNIENTEFRILKGSGKKNGRLNPHKISVCGNQIVFMTPMNKKDKPIRFYYRTGLFRRFYKINKHGFLNKKVCLNFKTTAQYLINLDDAAHFFGLKIQSVTIRREFINCLYQSSSGEELRKRNIRFAKYLSKKVNKKYEFFFLVVFDEE